MTKHYAIFPDELKSSILWDEDTDAWVYISGQPQKAEDPRNYYKIIPTLYRGVDLRAKAVSTMPFALMKGETEYDTSGEWQNKIGMIPSMSTLLYVIEASLTLAGRSYLKQEKNQAGYKKLVRHLDPTSVSLDMERAKAGELVFKRDNKTLDNVIHLWYPDPYVEIGPPTAYPAMAALNACGVLANVDEFAKKFFARGAIKAMLFAAEGMPKDQAEMFESWWQKFVSGIGNAFRTKVLNAAKVAPVVVGEGINELEGSTVTQERREEVAVALDVKFSMLFSNAANYATSVQDKRNWYDDFVIPECNMIAGYLNEQLFQPMGYRLEFQPETLDIMQEDEAQRAGSLKSLVDSGVPLLLAMDILGYELDDDQRAQLEAEEDEPEPEPQPVPPQLVQPEPEPESEPVPPAPKSFDEQLVRELSIWQSKCLKAVKRGDTADSIAFVPVKIPAEMYASISDGLKDAQDADAVRSVFAGATVGEPEPVRVDWQVALVAELKRANDLLEATAQ